LGSNPNGITGDYFKVVPFFYPFLKRNNDLSGVRKCIV